MPDTTLPRRYRTFIADNARWDGFTFRPGDIIISTPPKCGTTWLQRICSLLIFQTPELAQPLDLISPWLEQVLRPLGSVREDLEAQTHRRFIKSHTPYDGLPHDPKITYLAAYRDPRDVALSLDNHRANFDWEKLLALREAAHGLHDLQEFFPDDLPDPPDSERERIWAWIDDPTPVDRGYSFAALLNHLATFYAVRNEPNVVLLHYSDLKRDLEGEMRRLAARLGITAPEYRWDALVHAASFDQMKQSAAMTGPNQTASIWQDGGRFFHRAREGEWKRLFDEEDRLRYAARVAQLAESQTSEWIHRGPLRSGGDGS